MNLSEKMDPGRFPGMSPLMAAVVGYVLGAPFTDPQIVEIAVSEVEGVVQFRKEGDIRFEGIESLTDLRNNWNRLMDAADLTPDERKEAVRLFVAKVAILPGTKI